MRIDAGCQSECLSAATHRPNRPAVLGKHLAQRQHAYIHKSRDKSEQMPRDLLSLSASTIERLAMVRLDEPYANDHAARGKTFVFWVLRELGHPGLSAAAWDARHSVLKPTLPNVARFGDTEWCRVMVEGGAAVDENDRRGDTALMCASRSGHTKTVQALAELSADVNMHVPHTGYPSGDTRATIEEHLGARAANTDAVGQRSCTLWSRGTRI